MDAEPSTTDPLTRRPPEAPPRARHRAPGGRARTWLTWLLVVALVGVWTWGVILGLAPHG